MVSVVKSEWHQVEKRYGIEIDADILTEIYPDLDEDEIEAKLAQLESGEEDAEEVINEAWNNDVDIEWDYLNEDDWWTDRKGGYEVTYNVEEWKVHEDYVSPVTHKCTKCKWTGTQYDAAWSWQDGDGNEIDDPIKICPMCDRDTELTEVVVE
jgi:FAD/FMN-containing dehydrogenase